VGLPPFLIWRAAPVERILVVVLDVGCLFFPMSAVSLSQPEIISRLLEIHATRKAFVVEETKLLAQLQESKNRGSKNNTSLRVPLTFGKNAITWGEGQVLAIRGKGYKFVKALYEANKMRLKEDTLAKLVWEHKNPTHHNFKEFVRSTAEKLERAKFPYRLLPVMSKEKTEDTGKTHKGKPLLRRVQPEIIGVKLENRKFSAKRAAKSKRASDLEGM
jgi:hypothetical protein